MNRHSNIGERRRVKVVDPHAEQVGQGLDLNGGRSLAPDLHVRDVGAGTVKPVGNGVLAHVEGQAGEPDAASEVFGEGDVAFLHDTKASNASEKKQVHPLDLAIGRRFHAMRKAAKFTQDDAAAALDLARGRVSQLETGWPWSALHVWLAAKMLGCTPADLMMEDAPTREEWAIIQAVRRRDALAAVEAVTVAIRR